MRLRIGIVAGEFSGDILAAGLMRALCEEAADARISFLGAGGPEMQAAGLESVAPFEVFNVNGLWEPLLRLPSLLAVRRSLLRAFLDERIHAFVGADFNFFNFSLAARLKARGIATVHYVSPAVYAWRGHRARTLHRVIDLLLTLYPFEPALYADTPLRTRFVGHPLADELPLEPDVEAARSRLGLEPWQRVLAVFPGSRPSEVRLLGEDFLRASAAFQARHPDVKVCVAGVDAQIMELLQGLPGQPRDCLFVARDSRTVLEAADLALLKSGTCTLEAMLLHKPMVVAYRVPRISAWILRRLIETPWIALPNVLAGEPLVPELLQSDAHPAALCQALEGLLGHHKRAALEDRFRAMQVSLRQGANQCAARAILEFLRTAAHPVQPCNGP